MSTHVFASPEEMSSDFTRVRSFSEWLTRGLTPEDMVVQSMPDASPTKWHLAHTTWFFETFILKAFERDFHAFDREFEVLFNSYYNGVGAQFDRPSRGLLSRPTSERVTEYRNDVDARMRALLDERDDEELRFLVTIGLNHEQQHQELMLTDIKHVLAQNPLLPTFCETPLAAAPAADAMSYTAYPDGVREIGTPGQDEFVFDNETPRHRVFVQAYEVADRGVTCGEYADFIADGGYKNPDLWLSEGWSRVQTEGWSAPLYWLGEGRVFTLHGAREIDPNAPVSHVSYFEADAYARWAGARLLTEAEWEVASADARIADGQWVEHGALEPRLASSLFGATWDWTSSAYAPYPGYKPLPGTLGEYNGKFMVNQYVLRGGSCATSSSHIRSTYRNFFPTHARWQFSGIRLARSL